jgi:MHS family proline/betaine transporter-like MFS transporter
MTLSSNATDGFEAPASSSGLARPSLAIRAVAAATVGNLLEWYDFAIYGYFAALIGKLFFPAASATTSLLLTFATFGVGFLMRPLGAIIIGTYGDRFGRKNALMLTMGLMAAGTGSIGVLPTFETWGVTAAVALVAARLVQGFSAGGESGGSIAFIVEYAQPKRRGFVGSLQQSSVAGGLLLGSLTATILSTALSQDQMQAWAWRIPFLLGVLIAPVGMYLRSQLRDTPAYEAIKNAHVVAQAPLTVAMRTQWRQVLQGAGITLLWSVAYYVCFAYLPTFAMKELGLAAKDALLANTISLAAVILLSPLAGALSDQIGRKPLLVSATLAFTIASYPLLHWLLQSRDLKTLIVVGLSFAVALAMYNGPGPAALSELFPTSTRYTGLSVGYNISAALFGGFAPFASTYLIELTGQKVAPAYFIAVCAILTLTTLLSLSESFRRPLG